MPGRVSTGMPNFKSLLLLDQEKSASGIQTPGVKLLSTIKGKPSSTARLKDTTQTRTHSISCHDTNKTLIHNKRKAIFHSKTEGYNPNQDAFHQLPRHQQTTIVHLRTGHCRLKNHLKRIGVKTSAQCPVEKRTKHQNVTCNPAHSTTKQGSRYGPLVCPSKPSPGGLQRICSRHPSTRHSRERGSGQRNHHIERRRRRRRPRFCRFRGGRRNH